jgi:hypothetical protein
MLPVNEKLYPEMGHRRSCLVMVARRALPAFMLGFQALPPNHPVR